MNDRIPAFVPYEQHLPRSPDLLAYAAIAASLAAVILAMTVVVPVVLAGCVVVCVWRGVCWCVGAWQ